MFEPTTFLKRIKLTQLEDQFSDDDEPDSDSASIQKGDSEGYQSSELWMIIT